MPGQRPYASRGVPSRGSVRGTPHSSRVQRFVYPSLLLCAIAAVALWAHLATSAQPVRASQTPDLAAVATTLAPVVQPAGLGVSTTEATTRTPGPVARHRAWQGGEGIQFDATLAAQLDEALSGVDGQVGVVVKDLGSGKGAVLDGAAELQSASLYKLPVLYAVFDSGISFSEELPISAEARSYDSGTMELGVGESLSVAEAVERMVTLSDNTSAVMLGSRVGAAEVNASIRALGLDSTHYSLERMTTSALDMTNLLETIARGQAISASASADMVHLLLRQRVNDRIPRLLPDDVQAAHKTGNLPGVVNDVGLLYGPNATVAVAVLVSNTADETAAATGIARAALAAYSYFDAQPPVADRPLIPLAPTRPVPPVWRQPNPVVVATSPAETPRTQRGDAVDPAVVATANAATTRVSAGATGTPEGTGTPAAAGTPASMVLTPGAATPGVAGPGVAGPGQAHTATNARLADTPVVRFAETPVSAQAAAQPAQPASTATPPPSASAAGVPGAPAVGSTGAPAAGVPGAPAVGGTGAVGGAVAATPAPKLAATPAPTVPLPPTVAVPPTVAPTAVRAATARPAAATATPSHH